MNNFDSQFNHYLTRAYRLIEIFESKMLQEAESLNLTISEIHLLEAVGPLQKNQNGKTISELSDYLSISLPSVTLAINKLVRKGYVLKQKSKKDKRMVYVSLTRAGKKAEHAHRFFHRRMVRSITNEMSQSEKDVLLSGILKLNDFFDKKIESDLKMNHGLPQKTVVKENPSYAKTIANFKKRTAVNVLK